jgi:hypothetical protein
MRVGGGITKLPGLSFAVVVGGIVIGALYII